MRNIATGIVIALALAATDGAPTASAAPITYGFTVDITTTDATFAGVALPTSPFTTTGTLTYDPALPSSLAVPGFSLWSTDITPSALGPTSELTLDLGGSTVSSVPGELDALLIQSGSSADLLFGVDFDNTGTPTNATLLVDGVDQGDEVVAIVGLGTTTSGPFGDTLDFDPNLLTESPSLFPLPEFQWIVPGGGGQLDGTNLQLTGVILDNGPGVPEPASVAIWVMLAVGLVTFGCQIRRRACGIS